MPDTNQTPATEPVEAPSASARLLADFDLAALLVAIRPHAELDLTTLTYHSQQSDATARDGYWHASINEARSVMEALMVGIVRTVCVNDPRKPGTGNGTAFSNWRRYLVDAGFIDTFESDMLHFVYGLSSIKGSHHGVPDAGWARLARQMVFCTTAYLLNRFGEWKVRAAEGRVPPAPPSPPARSIRQRVVDHLTKWRPARRKTRKR